MGYAVKSELRQNCWALKWENCNVRNRCCVSVSAAQLKREIRRRDWNDACHLYGKVAS